MRWIRLAEMGVRIGQRGNVEDLYSYCIRHNLLGAFINAD